MTSPSRPCGLVRAFEAKNSTGFAFSTSTKSNGMASVYYSRWRIDCPVYPAWSSKGSVNLLECAPVKYMSYTTVPIADCRRCISSRWYIWSRDLGACDELIDCTGTKSERPTLGSRGQGSADPSIRITSHATPKDSESSAPASVRRQISLPHLARLPRRRCRHRIHPTGEICCRGDRRRRSATRGISHVNPSRADGVAHITFMQPYIHLSSPFRSCWPSPCHHVAPPVGGGARGRVCPAWGRSSVDRAHAPDIMESPLLPFQEE